MNLDLLRPFDKEAAQRGEEICIAYSGDACEFIAEAGRDHYHAVRATNGNLECRNTDDLRMKPLAWCEDRPVYKGDVLYWKGDGMVHEPYWGTDKITASLTWTPPEPVKKTRTVKMWQALLSDGAGFFTSSHFFTDENEAKVRFEKRFIRLLPHTEIEVEE